MESEVDNLKKFKDSSRALGQEVIDLKAKLSGMAHQTEDLVKENINLESKVAIIHEHIEKVKEAIKDYQVFQPMKSRVTMGTGLRTFANKLSSCSQTWTFPKSRSS